MSKIFCYGSHFVNPWLRMAFKLTNNFASNYAFEQLTYYWSHINEAIIAHYRGLFLKTRCYEPLSNPKGVCRLAGTVNKTMRYERILLIVSFCNMGETLSGPLHLFVIRYWRTLRTLLVVISKSGKVWMRLSLIC